MKTIDAAAGHWPHIFASYGIEPRALNKRNQPCPVTGEGTDRFRFSDRSGSGNYFCACSPDGRKGGIELLKCKTGKSFAELAREIDEMLGNKDDSIRPDKLDPKPLLRSIQDRCRPPGEEVTRYLEARRLIVPRTLREVADMEYWNEGKSLGKFPAMVGKIVDAKGKPRSYHVTYLKDGMKAPVLVSRKVMPPIDTVSGCAIRLYPQAPHIGIAEGIETAIAAHMMFRLPVWSCISRGGIEAFTPPEGIEAVTVFGDNDASFAGQAGAYKAAENLRRRKLAVDVKLPEKVGDWNDVLQAIA